MKTSVSRDAAVPAFAISLDELEQLHDTICKEFPDGEETRTEIDIEYEGIEYEFSSFPDLRNNYLFNESISDFRMRISSLVRSVDIGKPLFALAGGQVEVSARSETVVWCEGIVSLAKEFLTQRRVWYHGLVRTKSVIAMFAITSIAAAYWYSRVVPEVYGFDFLAVPVGIIFGLSLFVFRPKQMTVASLSDSKSPPLPMTSVFQLVITVLSLIASMVSILLQFVPHELLTDFILSFPSGR